MSNDAYLRVLKVRAALLAALDEGRLTGDDPASVTDAAKQADQHLLAAEDVLRASAVVISDE